MKTAIDTSKMKSVVCGRKHCTSPRHQGPTWLPLLYFHAAEYTDSSRTVVKRLQSHCTTCQRENTRRRGGFKPRQPSKLGLRTGPNGYIVETEEERRIYNAYQRERNRRKTPEQREERREYDRFRTDALRRRAGIPRRNLSRRLPSRRPGGHRIDAGPIREYLRALDSNGGVPKLRSVTPRRIRSLLRGEYERTSFDVVDRILTELDDQLTLQRLYPEED
jgi:hypothetical protein